MKKFLAVFIAIMFSLPCFATTWVDVGKYEAIDIDSIQVYKDDNGIIQNNKRTFWLKHQNKNGSHKSFEKLFKRKISHSENLCVMDIKNKIHTFKAYKFYDINEEFIYDYTEKDSKLKWTPIKKNSNAEFWYNVVTDEKLQKALIKVQQEKNKK